MYPRWVLGFVQSIQRKDTVVCKKKKRSKKYSTSFSTEVRGKRFKALISIKMKYLGAVLTHSIIGKNTNIVHTGTVFVNQDFFIII